MLSSVQKPGNIRQGGLCRHGEGVYMLGLGLASSHAPAMFEPQERWPLIYSRIPEYTKESQPHTAKLETPEVIQGYIDRINAAFAVLCRQLEAYQPEALIVV